MGLDLAETRLRDAIEARHDVLLGELRELVAIPSGRGHEEGLERMRAIFTDRLRALGAEVTVEPGIERPTWVGPLGHEPAPVLVARRAGASPRVLIVGHLDTVHDPAGAFRVLSLLDDGNATGPGCADMKGGLVVALAALTALDEAGVDLAWTVALNSDEETGSFSSAPVLRDLAREHDLGVVVEPALPDGALATERMGSGQFMIEVFGRSAHAGRDFASGASAVVELARVIGALHELARPEEGMIVNVGPLRGGDAVNVVPDHAAAWGNVRFADAARGEQLALSFERLTTPEDAVPRVVIHHDWNRPSKPATEAVRLFAAVARSTAEDLGQTLPFAATGGVCDGNILQSEGLPTLDTLGVRGGNLHRGDEYLEVASLAERACLLAVLLGRIAKGGVGGLGAKQLG
ncbi:MAG: hydrolase [Planctomycetota bacterium]|jgi:glutamate carboxypeptidase